jgi:transposase
MPKLHRHERSNEERALLRPLLPPLRTRGRSPPDDRTIVNGIRSVLHAGAPWREPLDRFGAWKIVYKCFRRWAQMGLADRLLMQLQARLERAAAGLGALVHRRHERPRTRLWRTRGRLAGVSPRQATRSHPRAQPRRLRQ